MVISIISITVAVAEPVTISMAVAETISKTVTISKIIVQVGDRWWNRVSVVTIAHRWRGVSRCVGHLRNGRCGVRNFRDGRCNGELSDGWSYRDLEDGKSEVASRPLFLFRSA